MKPLSISIQNFMSFRGTHLAKLADLGLVSVLGRNEVDLGMTANGVGKSTFIDALLWGLFGETGPRKESLTSKGGLASDDVLNEVVGKDCLVAVEFESRGSTWRVERWRKAGKAMRSVLRVEKESAVRLLHFEGVAGPGDVWKVTADLDADNVQKAIDQAAGIDLTLASQVLVRSQEDPFNFAQATPTERFAILTRIEGLDGLDAVSEKGRARSRELATNVAMLSAKISSAKSTIDLIKGEDLSAQIAGWYRERTRRQDELGVRLHQLLAIQQNLATQLLEKPALVAQLAQIEAAIAQCDAVRPPMPPQLEEWRKHLHDRQGQMGALNLARGALNARGAAAQASGAKLARSSARGVCPECEQQVTPEHVHAKRAAIDAELASVSAEGARLEAQQDALMLEVANATRTVGEIESSWAVHRNEVDRVKTQHVNAKMEVRNRLSQLEAIERQLSNTREADALRADTTRCAAEANPYEQRAAGSAARVVELEQQLVADEAELQRMHAEVGLVEWWIKNIPSMKAWIFDNVMGVLTSEANRWLAHLMSGAAWVQLDSTSMTKAGEARDKIGLRCFQWLSDGNFVERPFKRWSGGEKRRIALALDWALSSRLAQRASASCDFVFLDEVDRHLDKSGRDGLRSALEELRKEKSTVIVVSHGAELRLGATQTWEIVKDKNGSRIEVGSGALVAGATV